MHLYGLHGEAVRQLIDNRAKGLERLDINRGRPGTRPSSPHSPHTPSTHPPSDFPSFDPCAA